MGEERVRLSKIMSERGICSRREADRFIEQGVVCVDGRIVSALGTKVARDACVELLEKAQKVQKNKVTLILNKPVGFVSTQPEKGYRPAIELIRPENQERGDKKREFRLNQLSVVGRLDIDSKGLLIFTQDGVLAKRIIGEDSQVEKEYRVRVEGKITPSKLERLTFGLSLDGDPLKPAGIKQLASNVIQCILRQGKKRQIRRMCDLVDLQVVGLKRVRVGKIRLGDLPEGQWRFLRPNETM